jgi:integrase
MPSAKSDFEDFIDWIHSKEGMAPSQVRKFANLILANFDAVGRTTRTRSQRSALLSSLAREKWAQISDERRENVDLTGATLLIPDPKNRQPHMLPLTPFLKEMLTKRWDGRENEYVFPGQGEKYRYIRDVRHHMHLVTESSKVKFMLHDLDRKSVV